MSDGLGWDRFGRQRKKEMHLISMPNKIRVEEYKEMEKLGE